MYIWKTPLEHFLHPFSIKNSEKESISLDRPQKLKIIALSSLIGLCTFGIGAIPAFYFFAKRYKIEKIKNTQISTVGTLWPKYIRKPTITLTLSGGRLGDCLIGYLKAKYISVKYGHPLLIKDFKYLSCFTMNEQEQHIPQRYVVDTCKEIASKAEIETVAQSTSQESILYDVQFLADICDDNLQDEEFLEEARKMMAPQNKELQPQLDLPQDKVCIAVHVRTGGAFKGDSSAIKRKMPTKFPPDSFYIEGISQVAAQNEGKSLYIQIFTDSETPQAIIDRFSILLKEKNINDVEFVHRPTIDDEDGPAVLKDFFSMVQFENMVRPNSSLSQTASIIGSMKTQYIPQEWGVVEKEGANIVVPGRLYNRSL